MVVRISLAFVFAFVVFAERPVAEAKGKRTCVPALKMPVVTAWRSGSQVRFCGSTAQTGDGPVAISYCASFNPKNKRFRLRRSALPKETRLSVKGNVATVCKKRKKCRSINLGKAIKPRNIKLRGDGGMLAVGVSASGPSGHDFEAVEIYSTRSGRKLKRFKVKCGGFACTEMRWLYDTLMITGFAAGPDGTAFLYNRRSGKRIARVGGKRQLLSAYGMSTTKLSGGRWAFIGNAMWKTGGKDKEGQVAVIQSAATGKVIRRVSLAKIPAAKSASDDPGETDARAFVGLSRWRVAVIHPSPKAGLIKVFDLRRRRVVSTAKMPSCR